MINLSGLDPQPAGFPGCMTCPYRTTGTPAICFACANGGTAPVPAAACPVCGQELVDGDRCANTVCNLDDRWFSRVYTASWRQEEMWAAISHYKYDQDREWAPILGRILVGFLEERRTAGGRAQPTSRHTLTAARDSHASDGHGRLTSLEVRRGTSGVRQGGVRRPGDRRALSM
ncbi:hypothetical protein SAMN05661080_05147 [Modestobacter sp. DSM 44400]|nr:hypothetical protein SAMN05661080_05147 [Modestobacter sp. DSM 44400]